jgi:hypothetical protein
MAKYRKKPVIVEAEQWFPGKDVEGVIDMAQFSEIYLLPENQHLRYQVKTLEGFHVVSPWDWIITGIHGEKYPCKPDIFEKTYELVEE